MKILSSLEEYRDMEKTRFTQLRKLEKQERRLKLAKKIRPIWNNRDVTEDLPDMTN